MTDLRARAVEDVLREAGELGDGERVVALEQLPAGWSRHSYLAQLSGERRVVVRVRPAGALLDTDLELEHDVFAALAPTPVPAPGVFGIRRDADSPFGGPFFVMEFRPGDAPNMYGRGDQEMLAADFAGGRTVATDMVRALAAIHALGEAEMPAEVPRRSFADVAAQWQDVYEQRRLVRDPVIEEGFRWLADNAPAEERFGLVHGDFRIGNTLIHERRLSAVLDWELVHLGDVRFDLGYLALRRAAGKHLRRRTPLMGTFAELGWFLERYGELTGEPVSEDELAPFQMLSIMMLLATQITAVRLHVEGRTDDFRMVWARNSFPGLRDDMVELMQW